MDASVVICTRNRSQSLRRSLQFFVDLKAACAWELIVVDNNSSDGTAEIVTTARQEIQRLKYVLEERIGLGAARDRGWRESVGRIVIFTDDDCYPDPAFIDAYVLAFNSRQDVGYMGGRIHLWDETDIRTTTDYRKEPVEIEPYQFIPAGALQGANMAIRRSVLEQIGGVDPELGAGTPFPCEDIDLVARAAWSGHRGRYDPAPLVHHHHGRKKGDELLIMKGYDRGRGAYYMKYILRKDTRRTYAKAWL